MKTDYLLKSHLTARGMRTRHEVWCAAWKALKDAVILIAMLLGLLFAIENLTYEAVAGELVAQRDKAEATWLSCLNHKGVWVNGELHLCSLANVWIRKEEK